MARPLKVGLDYFELDCQLDDKIRLIQAEFGLIGFAVVVKLFQKIYGTNGYYCEWNDDISVLFASENGLSGSSSVDMINEIVKACIRRGIFSAELFKKYSVLTSSGIQKRYLNATSKREKIELKKEYLLLTDGINSKNVVINSVSDVINSVSYVRNTQSRVEKSKEEKSRVKESKGEKRKEKNTAAPEGFSSNQMIEEKYFSAKLEEAVKTWIAYKKEKHKSYKQIGLKQLLTKIEQEVDLIGDDGVISTIEKSITNNWDGLFFDEKKPDKKNNRTPTARSDERGAAALLHMMKEGKFDE